MPDQQSFPQLNNDNDRVALIVGDDRHSYAEVNHRIDQMATGLLTGKADLEEERIAFFMPASLDYVTTIHGIWRAGGIAIPLNVASAIPELEHYLGSAGVTRIIANTEYQDYLRELCNSMNINLVTVAEVLVDQVGALPELSDDRRAMMLFTSGTTNKPKGVVTTRKNIHAQITTLVEAWAWQDDDSIPLFLPLHHIHGIINILCCGLWAGATIHLYKKFDAATILGHVTKGTYSVFMAVPTIYVKIIQYMDTLDENERQKISDGFKAMRLNISGSAACPVKLFNQWKDLTGQILLERYGMTEIGMGISNLYSGERRAGAVGKPLPGVEAALFDEDHQRIEKEETPGEIRIKGDNVFLEYWDNPKATEESFHKGWFCTGDVAVIEKGFYRIMGRSSVDIIKSGGYKLSALEIEGSLLLNDKIVECAVIGVDDDTWGEAVTAFLVLQAGQELSYEELKNWCDGKLSAYKIPKRIILIDSLPRNAMGKVTKPDLKKMV